MSALRLVQFSIIALLLLGTTGNSSGAVSYLLIQGDFDTGTVGLESSRWQVNDPGGTLASGQDLLNAVFGAPQLVSGNHYNTSPTTWVADGSVWEVNYTLNASYGFFVDSFKRNGQTLVPNFTTGKGWSYYNAGGTYVDALLPPDYDTPTTGPYPSGSWTAGYSGASTRSLLDTDGNGTADPPFDAWVYGNDGYAATPQATVTGFVPSAASFAGANLNLVSAAAAPEPSRLLLLLTGAAFVLLRRSGVIRGSGRQ